jgi:hypothetical protein
MKTIARKTAKSSDQAVTVPAPPTERLATPSSGSPHPAQPKAGTIAPKAAARISKQDQLAALLLRDEGATLDQMVAATGWLPHTTRAALTGLRKKGYAIDSDKVDGVRTYRAVAPK